MVSESVKTTDYVHVQTGKNIPFGIAGFYTPLEETRLEHEGREFLYVTGKVEMEAPCCEMAPNWIYAIVPGFIVEWQHTENDKGEKVSLVEPVKDKATKEAIRTVIQEREGIVPVDFW